MKALKSVLAIMLAVLLTVCAGGCLKYTGNILEVTGQSTNPTAGYLPPVTDAPTAGIDPGSTDSVNEPTSLQQEVPATLEPATNEPASNIPSPSVENTTDTVADPASWNKAQALQNLATAVNKTKAYVGNVSVNHAEEYVFDITECPGGSIVKNVVNGIVSGIVKPTDETLNFSGGKAVDSDGETVVILLPQKQSFALTEDGVTSATAVKSGNNTVITVKLVSELGTINSAPKYNALGTGYIDVSSLSISNVTIDSFDVTYTGSTIVATINPEGYVVSCNYNIPFDISASGSVAIASGTVKANGYMQENWSFNW